MQARTTQRQNSKERALQAQSGLAAQTKAGASGNAAMLLSLQRSHGNRFVQRMLEAAVLQRDCGCGSNQLEQNELSASGDMRRKPAVQQESSPVPSVVSEVLSSPGQPLDSSARAFMQPRFGRDFGDVRVHTGPKASDSARAVNALAYTVGPNIVFAAGQYNPATQEGRRLLAHELAHTVQQAGAGSGPISGISQPGDASEIEAERVADSVMRKEELGSARVSFNIHEESPEDEDEEERTPLQSSVKKEAVIPGYDEDKLKTEADRVACTRRITSAPGAAPVLARVVITWAAANYSSNNNNAASTCVDQAFVPAYTATKDTAAGVWRMGVASISGGVDITVCTGGSRDPTATPPTTEAEAKQSVKVMKGYYARGTRGAWHTEQASKVHEQHHEREWKCTGDHYWPAAEKAVNKVKTPLAGSADATAAVNAMKPAADGKMASFRNAAKTYWGTLGDAKGDRPYAAGQAVLNGEVTKVQQLAATKGWNVKAGTTKTSGTEPPCYKPFLLVDFGRLLHII